MSLLTIVQDAMALCGLGRPTNVYSSSDSTLTQFVSLAQVEGDDLSRFTNWRSLKVSGVLTGDGVTVYWDLPSDFDRFLDGGIFWSTDEAGTNLVQVTDEEMLALKAQGTTPVEPVWRLFGEQIEIWPALDLSELVTTEYRTTNWILDNDGVTRKARWTADTDRAVIPERLITLGLVWRWKQAKGFDYSEAFRDYQFARAKQAGNDGARPTINISETGRADIAKMGRPAYYRVIP